MKEECLLNMRREGVRAVSENIELSHVARVKIIYVNEKSENISFHVTRDKGKTVGSAVD